MLMLILQRSIRDSHAIFSPQGVCSKSSNVNQRYSVFVQVHKASCRNGILQSRGRLRVQNPMCVDGWLENHLRLMILEGGLQEKYETRSERQVK